MEGDGGVPCCAGADGGIRRGGVSNRMLMKGRGGRWSCKSSSGSGVPLKEIWRVIDLLPCHPGKDQNISGHTVLDQNVCVI